MPGGISVGWPETVVFKASIGIAGSGRSVGNIGLQDGGAVGPDQKRAQHAAPQSLARHQLDEAGAIEAVELSVAFEIVWPSKRSGPAGSWRFPNIGAGDVER